MKNLLYLFVVLLAGCGEQAKTQTAVASTVADAASQPKEVTAQVPAETELDRVNGFRGIQFGASPKALRNANQVFSNGTHAWYAQTQSDYDGTDGVSGITNWGFENGHLQQVSYMVNGKDIKRFLKEFRAKFGQEITSHDTMYWRGRTVIATGYVHPVDENKHNMPVLDSTHESNLEMTIKKL